MCADLIPSLPPDHPLRHAWRQYFEPHGVRFIREQSIVFNAGFVGVSRQHSNFLQTWQRLLLLMEPAIGGRQNVFVKDRTFLFHIPDQDVFNTATMVCDEPMSSSARMGWPYVRRRVVHHEPCRRRRRETVEQEDALERAARDPRRRADKAFWKHASAPIRLYSPWWQGVKKLDLLAASALGRYIHL